jgi:hypothetical protein
LQLSSVDVAVAYVDTDREYGAEVKHTVFGYALRFKAVQTLLICDQLLKHLERGSKVMSWLNDSASVPLGSFYVQGSCHVDCFK